MMDLENAVMQAGTNDVSTGKTLVSTSGCFAPHFEPLNLANPGMPDPCRALMACETAVRTGPRREVQIAEEPTGRRDD